MSFVLEDRPAEAPPAPLELTILMPCLNEAETLANCIAKAMGYLARSGVHGEVLIADNGSTDGSQDIARGLGARVVHVPRRGYGAALITGIEAARGRFVIMGDSDDSYDFTSLDPFVEKLREGHQLVMGNRFLGGIAPGAMPPLHRYLGNPVLTTIGRVFFGSPVRDFHCGLRGFDRESILALGLRSPGMEFASEMVVKATVQKLRLRYTKRGRLRFTSHRDIARAFERALRRAQVPMAYSAGFSPHPKISWVGAAPTGVASEAEYVEISLAVRVDLEQLRVALDASLPDGID
ncbi:MAG: TIGR03936 family radical SAM-associated protein, partial [Alphaproteobacteria bacterium]|nr:TIGR03936 family radical SAM-associated protein [Alphaproteobacteria bacterium]